ncbi:hypothetical protein ACL02O_13745 [Micromonospora sp. MS34]|uniref:hypothetical protein n=1 Tax=Micromonospora sp. MS34 TaxID=3385971 RepID=UPI0039A0EBDD
MRPEEALDRLQFRMLRAAVEAVQAMLFFATVSITAGSVAWAWLSHAGGDVDATGWAVAGGGALSSGAFGYLAGRRRRRTERGDFVIEQLEGLLTVSGVSDHQRYDYVRRQRIRAGRNGFRLVPIRSHWSARSRCPSTPECLYADQLLLDGRTPEEDGRIRRWIYLHRPIGRGYRVWVGLRHTFSDDGGRMQPYYRESGEEQRVDRLIVRLRFTWDRVPLEVVGVRWSARSRSSRQETGEVPFQKVPGPDGSVEYVVDVHKPDGRCAYGLRWRWADDNILPVDAMNSRTVTRSAPMTAPAFESLSAARRAGRWPGPAPAAPR